ncbi:PKS-NRPS hybrid synthetase [Glycine soja]
MTHNYWYTLLLLVTFSFVCIHFRSRESSVLFDGGALFMVVRRQVVVVVAMVGLATKGRDWWVHDSIMSEEVNMNEQNEDEAGVNEEHIDYFDVFNTSQYKAKKKDLVRTITYNRKCGCSFKLRAKLVVGGEGWMMKLICGSHNHELAKSLVGHRYEYIANSYETIKQIYNAINVYRSSIRDSNTEMQQLLKLIECDQFIHWHRLKDDIVCDIFWSHPSAFKLTNACNLVFLIDSTYKTNSVTPIEMTFSTTFAYLKGERLNNVVWALQRFTGLFLRHDALPGVIVTDRDLALMNAVKTVFLKATNLLCLFHIDKNVKIKCKTLVGKKKNTWDCVMETWASLVDCPSEQEFNECLKKFEIACSPWPMFVDYVNQTWLIPHKERFVKAWTNKAMHLGNTIINSVWEVMNNMITLQYTKIKTFFETSTHVVGHVFKVTLYKKLLGMISRYALNYIVVEYKHVSYAGTDSSCHVCVMRITHDLPCACELARYVVGSIPLGVIHMFRWRLSFLDQGLSEPEVNITKEMETKSKRFEELDVYGKVTLKSKLREIAYPDLNSMCDPLENVKTKGTKKKMMTKHQRSTKRDPSYWKKTKRTMLMLDQFHPCIHDSIENIVDVKVDGNYGYRAIVALLGMGEDSWSFVRNHLLKELAKWSVQYINLFGSIDIFEELKRSLLVDGLSMAYNFLVTIDKWMNITDLGYVIASRIQPPTDCSVHRVICISHVYDNHLAKSLLPLATEEDMVQQLCHHAHHGWMFRRIPRLCKSHEGMKYHVKPFHVVCCTLFGRNTYLTHRYYKENYKQLGLNPELGFGLEESRQLYFIKSYLI